MKKKILYLCTSSLVIITLAGCAPQLARTKYGTTDNAWRQYIQESYPAWTPTPTPPPMAKSISDDASAGLQSGNAGLVGEPVDLSSTDGASAVVTDNDNADYYTSGVTGNNQNIPKSYTAQKGDTLWSIASKLYGDPTQWKSIYDANKDIIGGKPRDLRAGQVLTIPAR